MKSTWSILNEVINNKKSNVMLMTRKYPIQLRSRTKIPPCLTSHRSFLSGAFVNSLYQQPTTEQEILLKFVLVFVQELLQAMTKLLRT